jgi:hypothetical protein
MTYKAVVLATDSSEFLPADIVLDVQRLVDEAEIPSSWRWRQRQSNAWLTAQFCDAAVYSRQAPLGERRPDGCREVRVPLRQRRPARFC